MATPAIGGEMPFSVELFSRQNLAGSANNLVNGHLKGKKKDGCCSETSDQHSKMQINRTPPA
jgi:hypothetical protein